MNCAKCQSNDVDEKGKCRACGFQPEGPASTEPISHSGALPPGMIEMHSPVTGGAEAADIPPWRKELSKRLQEIKQKRERAVPGEPVGRDSALPNSLPAVESRAASESEPSPPSEGPGPTSAVAVDEPPAVSTRPSAKRITKGESRPKPRVIKEPRESLPLFQPLQPGHGGGAQEQGRTERKEQASTKSPVAEIARLIDNILIQHPPTNESSGASLPSIGSAALPRQSKLILLSRTLAGVVDWIILILCAGAFILAADYIAGIDFVDRFTVLFFSLLLLAVYLVYSFFFLLTAGQTIGMMFTDLRLTATTDRRPSLNQVSLRCLGYLLSVAPVGLGLAWAVFDPDSKCLHDRISGTQVSRIGW